MGDDLALAADDLFAANLGKKKKRKKKAKVKATPTDVDADGTTQDGTETESNTASEDAVMTYKDMLDRAYRAIKENNPDITEKKTLRSGATTNHARGYHQDLLVKFR